MSAKVKTIAFAGGGSGGHVYPLIAVADQIRRLSPETKCFFVSTPGSIEEKLVPRAGYELLLVRSGKLAGQGFAAKLKTSFQLLFSFFQCFFLVLRRRPDFVFSAGGYAGAPFMVLAALCGVPCAILEQNRKPGIANRWMAKFCKKIFLNFAATADSFPGKETLVVGHPCRTEIEQARWSASESETKFAQNPFRVFIFGGSQGARGINRLVTAALPHLKGLDVFLHHQTGADDFEVVKKEYEALGLYGQKNIVVEPYVYEMAKAYSLSQLVICRAGASSLAELAAAAKAAVLIPLVSKDRHQEHNAKEVAALGACAVYLQPELSGEKLAAILKEIYYDRKWLAAHAEKMGALHNPTAAANIAHAILGS